MYPTEMEDQRFRDIALECGLDADEYTDYGTSTFGVPVPPRQDQPYYDSEDFGEYADEIENSSPSPAGRTTLVNPFASQRQRHLEDEITQYEKTDNEVDPFAYGAPVRYSQAGYQLASSSTSTSVQPSYHRRAQYETAPLYDSFEDPRVSKTVQGHDALTNSCHPSLKFADSAADSDYRKGADQRNEHGIRLRPVSELPDVYRAMFKFGVFNAIQSVCFDDVMHSDENLVISAPTGSGKTVLFELAIIRMLNNAPGAKCVYMAPTKALCSERHRDWTAKFEALGIKCCELTGDTVQFGKSAWGDAKNATVIVTTGEKWDSLTRHWRDHGQILSQVQLFLVDEVHILNESRGSTLEVVISRMKTRGTAVRFVLVSATVPNIADISSWIGSVDRNGPAKVFEFGEEFRPCKLTRFVYGVPRNKNQNDWTFQKSLDYRLFPVLQQHSVNKPILVFASTRKGVFSTAEHLASEFEKAVQAKQPLPWAQPKRFDRHFHDKRLDKLASFGIGVHHAGLSMDDRRATEDLYLKKILRLLVATSTLAVGVNLPAHTVVIEGVKMYGNNGFQEYSDLDVMQMIGRAGRPQFDKEGVAIILCEVELEAKYKALVQGKTILESSLHRNLSEHINSEIGLGTITDVNTAKDWLHNSFLFQRIQKNPRHYAIGKETAQSWQERLDDMVMQSVFTLKQSQLVEYADEESGLLCSTDYGDIMSKFYIRQSTMNLILKLPERATVREILETMSGAEEFSDLKLRGGEKAVYNKLREHDDIRFKIKKVEKVSDKVFLLIQAVLGGISLNSAEYKSADSQPPMEALSVFRHVGRVARAVVEVALVKKCGPQIKHGLELVRCLTAKAWEDRPVVLRQIEQIGDKSLKVLAEHGITSLDVLRKQDPLRIETLLNRRSPFGFDVLSAVAELPQYFLSVAEVNSSSTGGKGPVEVELSIKCGLENNQSSKSKKQKTRRVDMTAILTLTSDLDFLDFRRISTKVLTTAKTFTVTAQLARPSQSIVVYMISESIAGVTVSQTHKPRIDPKEFPVVDTRPLNSVDADLAGLEDDPNFWDMGLDDEDVPMKDLTKPHGRALDRSTRPSVSEKSGNKSGRYVHEYLETRSPDPKKMSNGNYECNHVCKDKTKCLHLCCREGVSKPPPPSKRRQGAVTTTNQSKSKPSSYGSSQHLTGQVNIVQPGDGDREKPKQKKSLNRMNLDLQQLDSLHERTNVAHNIKLRQGQRLKLEDDASQATKRKRATPNFDIEFADLNDCKDDDVQLDHHDTDDEEFPEPKDLLKAACRSTGHDDNASSETNYSNAEIDALILQVPSDKSVETTDGLSSTSTRSKQHRLGVNRHHTISRSSPCSPPMSAPIKRSRQPEILEIDPPSKRVKLAGDRSYPVESTPPVTSRFCNKDQHTPAQTMTQEPLFLPDTPDYAADHKKTDTKPLPVLPPSPDNTARDLDEFQLDESLFNILPSTPAPMTSTSRTNDCSLRTQTYDWRSTHFPIYAKSDATQDRLNQKTPAWGSTRIQAELTATRESEVLIPNVEIASKSNQNTVNNDAQPDAAAEDDGYGDPIAELEAWLNSGAVDIIPDE